MRNCLFNKVDEDDYVKNMLMLLNENYISIVITPNSIPRTTAETVE